jgi:vitamin B12 transporter
LKPEDGWGGDLGAAWNHTTGTGWRIDLSGNAHAQWYDNSIHWYNGLPRNVGGAFFYGADIGAGLALPLQWGPFRALKFSLSYQYMMSYLLAYGYTFASDRRVPYMPIHHPGIKTELSWETGHASFSGYFEAERVAEDYITVLDPYAFLTLNVSQRIGKHFSAYAVLRNILNSRYQSFKDYPMPGFTLTLGMRVQFEDIAVSGKKEE